MIVNRSTYSIGWTTRQHQVLFSVQVITNGDGVARTKPHIVNDEPMPEHNRTLGINQLQMLGHIHSFEQKDPPRPTKRNDQKETCHSTQNASRRTTPSPSRRCLPFHPVLPRLCVFTCNGYTHIRLLNAERTANVMVPYMRHRCGLMGNRSF